ncbi:unnamed protein product [Gadus morhua 'NCC']
MRRCTAGVTTRTWSASGTQQRTRQSRRQVVDIMSGPASSKRRGTRKRVLKVRVLSEDIQELNDPAMKTAILKQIQKMLNEGTLRNHHKIAWKTNSDGQVFTKE